MTSVKFGDITPAFTLPKGRRQELGGCAEILFLLFLLKKILFLILKRLEVG